MDSAPQDFRLRADSLGVTWPVRPPTVWIIQHNMDVVMSQLRNFEGDTYLHASPNNSNYKIEQRMDLLETKIIQLENNWDMQCRKDVVDNVDNIDNVDNVDKFAEETKLKKPIKKMKVGFHSRFLNFQENNDKLNFKINTVDSKERELQLNQMDEKNNILPTNEICDQTPILFPYNHVNNFTYDKRLDLIVGVVDTSSSSDLFHQFNSPQYKAACHLMFDDNNKEIFQVDLLMERYVILLFLYSADLYDESDFPFNTCDYEGIECDSKNGNIIRITWCK